MLVARLRKAPQGAQQQAPERSMSAEQILRDATASGRPCVLFLGQDTDLGTAPGLSVLSRLLERKGQLADRGWRDALTGGLSSDDLEWLTERFERTVPTE